MAEGPRFGTPLPGSILLDFEGERRDIDAYAAAGGYEQLQRALGLSTEEIVAQLMESGLRGRGGAGFPTGRKASFLAPAAPALPRRQRRRVRAGHVQGPRDHAAQPARADRGHPDHVLGHPRGAGLHLHPRRVPDGVRGAGRRRRAGPGQRAGSTTRCRARTTRRHRRPPRRRRLHLRRGDRPARLARTAIAASRPLKPPFPAVAGAFTAARRCINNVETLANVPYILRMGGELVQRDRHRAVQGHARLLAVGPGEAAGQLRAAAGAPRSATSSRTAAAAARTAGRSRASARRLSRADPDAGSARRQAGLRVRRGGGLDVSARAA